jgi:hypothetical protein
VPGQDFKVDAGVWDLIVTLNRVPGLWTLYSCQGGGDRDGWVTILGEAVPSFIAFIAQQRVPLTLQLWLWRDSPSRAELCWEPRQYKSILRLAQAFEASRICHNTDWPSI